METQETNQRQADQDDINQLEPHLYTEWQDKIVEDGMFNDTDCPSNWHITASNALEFLEALYITDYLTEEELIKVIEEWGVNNYGNKQTNQEGDQFITYDQLVPRICELLLYDKAVSIEALFQFENCALPIDRITKFLKMLKMDIEHKKYCEHGDGLSLIEERYLKEISFAQNRINQRAIFTTSMETVQRQQQRSSNKLNVSAPGQKGRLSMRDQWLNQYSDVGSVLSDLNTLQMSKAVSSHLEYSIGAGLGTQKISQLQGQDADGSKQKMRRKTTINYLFDLIEKHKQNFEDLSDIKFDIFKLCDMVGREQLLPVMMLTTMYNTGLKPIVNEGKVALFLDKVVTAYRQDVQYHNDLHGADVMQMAYYMLSKCGLQIKLKLNKLDTLSFLMAAVCHDLGHDGYTNSYHVNAITRRAIDSNDVAVQETFHASEFFRIMDNTDVNFLEELSRTQYKVFRKRVMGLILATDMARHVADMSAFNAILDEHDIKAGKNLEKLIEVDNEAVKSNNQQIVMEQCLHACDISQQGRDFKTVHEWTYLLFEEFFDQGDLEKKSDLPISMLCDRSTTKVAASQAGFIGFVPLPIFTALTNVMPELSECVVQMKANSKAWKAYEETEEDKKVYLPRVEDYEPRQKNIVKQPTIVEPKKEEGE